MMTNEQASNLTTFNRILHLSIVNLHEHQLWQNLDKVL